MRLVLVVLVCCLSNKAKNGKAVPWKKWKKLLTFLCHLLVTLLVLQMSSVPFTERHKELCAQIKQETRRRHLPPTGAKERSICSKWKVYTYNGMCSMRKREIFYVSTFKSSSSPSSALLGFTMIILEAVNWESEGGKIFSIISGGKRFQSSSLQ